ncbi:MAG: TetR family transcriptional regulator C-terminal domain-containing protein [Rhodospirillales bacterium]|nr:TetR family transcriptional regulator C-terminal domain-containing protein [Rhodospirillales bacterium]
MRQHLIATGLRVLHGQGFNGCGVQEITDAAQVPKGSFYNHFDSKEQFGAEVLGRYWEERLTRAQGVLSDETRPPLERLRAYFDAKTGIEAPRAAAPSKSFARGCMIGNFAAELAGQSRLVRDRLDLVYAGWTRLLAACIRDAQRDGSLQGDDDPETLAAFLIDAFEGAVLRSKVDQDATALHRFHRIVFTRLLV